MPEFYYKNGNAYLVSKHELGEEEIGDYELITEEEYNQHIAALNHAESNSSSLSLKKARIYELKALLRESDYQAIKYAEGWISEQDYAPIKELRQSYRDEINQLEQEIENEQ